MRCGCLPPESSVSTISSFAVAITAILLARGIPTQTPWPFGEIVIASAPSTGRSRVTVNVKTLGLTIPLSLLVRADEVIESAPPFATH